jgi:regulatory protein
LKANPSSKKAKAYALLAKKDYTCKELAQKLDLLPEDPILEELCQEGFLNDRRYAERFVFSKATRYGNRRLRYTLLQKGLKEDDIEAALAQAEDEALRMKAILSKRVLPDKDKAFRFLAQRGFDMNTIRMVLDEAFGNS